MNILFIVGKYPDDGGVAKVSEVLAVGLQERGHKVYIGSFIYEKDNIIGIDTFQLEQPITKKQNITELHNFVENHGINVVVCQWATDFRVSRLCKKSILGTHCKLISVLHTAPGRTAAIQNSLDKLNSKLPIIAQLVEKGKLFINRIIAKRSLQLTVHYSDYFLSLSPSLLCDVKSFLGETSNNRMGYIYNPVTVDTSQTKDIAPKKNQLLFVGRLDNHTKKVIRTLQVWHLLEKQYPKWEFCIVGDGPDKEELENYVREHQISRVTFAGYVNPTDYYKESKILLLTSSYEGFPLVLGEAMSYGVVPAVTNSFVSAKDIIRDNVSGLIVDIPFDAITFARALSKIMSNEDKWQLLSDRAKERALSLQLPKVLDTWEDLFTKI